MISLVEDGVKLAETREERAYYAMQNGVTGSAILGYCSCLTWLLTSILL